MNRRFLIALAGAIVFGLLAIFLAQKYVTQRVQQKIAEEETNVVIAAADIPLGTEINAQQVTLARFKRTLIPEGALLKKEEVIGRVTTSDISAKMVVLGKQLAGIGALPGLSGTITEGMRSVSVRVDEASGVAGFVSPGAYVDVIAIMNPQLEGAKAVSKVILQKVRVLASGQKNETNKDGKPALVNTVTMELTPGQAEKVKLAEAEGKLQLSIRNSTDQDLPKTPGATKRDVLDDIALEQRALIGTRQNGGGGARPMPTIQPWTINVNNPNDKQPQQGPQVKKVNLEKTIELIEGTKRSRIEMVP
ncbi:MAG TPA: Flp pilus assembly protein CpaB [Blastocatellia bacterium]|nr:Flp pilus assembly protein CpaB [Blastocatellia bacterium]